MFPKLLMFKLTLRKKFKDGCLVCLVVRLVSFKSLLVIYVGLRYYYPNLYWFPLLLRVFSLFWADKIVIP